jgi:hypothetical protein
MMNAVPDGNSLVDLRLDLQKGLLNFRVPYNDAQCVNSSLPH